MTSDRTSLSSHLPAPCIVDAGIVVNKQDMRRILCDLGAVYYRYTQGDRCISEGKGYVVEVFSDLQESTLVTNHSLYLNVCSFDYLELSRDPGAPERSEDEETSSEPAQLQSPSQQSSSQQSSHEQASSSQNPHQPELPDQELPKRKFYFDLVQENTRLQLIPLSNPLKARRDRTINAVALEAVVADMLSTNLDINDDEDHFPF